MRTKERIKTILLFVLILGATLLTYLIWNSYTGNSMGESADIEGVTIVVDQGQKSVMPFAISYKIKDGRFGAAYHSGSVSAVYDKLAPVFNDVFKGAGAPQQVTDKEWKRALLKNGILIDFEGNAPLVMFVDTLALPATDYGISFRYMIIADREVYLKNTKENSYYCMKSTMGENELVQGLLELSATPCTLAYEAGNNRVSPETIMFEENVSTFAVNSVNFAETLSEAQLFTLLKVFNMNYNTCGKHVDMDGSHTFIEGLSTLKIMPDGYVLYESDAQSGNDCLTIPAKGNEPTSREWLDGAESIMQNLNAFTGGDAVLYIRESDEASIRYGRSYGGIPIDRSKTGYSAEIKRKGVVVTRLGFYMRSYKAIGNAAYILPQKLAIASVPQNSGREISLRYADSGLGGIDAQWYMGE